MPRNLSVAKLRCSPTALRSVIAMKISTQCQARDGNSLEAQKTALTAAGATEIFSDAFTGTKTDRPELNKLLEKIASGDTLIFTKLDRVARNLTLSCTGLSKGEHTSAPVDDIYENEVRIDRRKSNPKDIINQFLPSGKDLFTFIEDYDFGQHLTLNEKIDYYVYLVSTFHKQLAFTDEYLERDGRMLLKIYPRSRELNRN